MTFNVANGAHVEWQGLEIFEDTANPSQLSIVTTPLTGLPDSWSRVLQFTGDASPGGVTYPQYGNQTNITAPSANHVIWHGYLRWTDVTPGGTEYQFLSMRAAAAFGAAELYFILETDGDIRVMDNLDVAIATITPAQSGLTNDTWHLFAIRYLPSATVGEVQVWIDGTEVLANQTGEVLANYPSMDYIAIEGPTASSGNMFFAGAHTRINSTTVDDRLNDDFEWVGPYQNDPDDTSATPDTGILDVAGEDLSAGDWGDVANTPLNESSTGTYDTPVQDGGMFLNTGVRQGPAGDSRIDGDSNIIGSQALFWAKRSTGGGLGWTFLSGNTGDDYDAAATMTVSSAATSNSMWYLVTNAATAVPLSTEDGMLGMQMNSGARDLILSDWAMFILHVPDVAPSGRIMGSIAGSGGLAGKGGIAGEGGGLAG